MFLLLDFLQQIYPILEEMLRAPQPSGLSELGVQVVGRVHRGLEILEKVNESAVDPDDLPLQRITITSCGLTDAQVQSPACSSIRHACLHQICIKKILLLFAISAVLLEVPNHPACANVKNCSQAVSM